MSPSALEHARWPLFEEVLQREILDRSATLKALEARRRLSAIGDQVLTRCRDEDRRLERMARQMREGYAALERARDHVVAHDLPALLDKLEEGMRVTRAVVAREVEDARRPVGGWLSPLALDGEDARFLMELLVERASEALGRFEERLVNVAWGPVDATLKTMERLSGALPGAQGQELFRRLSAFVSEERVLRLVLDERVIGHQRAAIRARAMLLSEEKRFVQRLADQDLEDAAREALLVRATGSVDDARVDGIASWLSEYFDAALGLCDNVRRDLERFRVVLQDTVMAPFEGLLSRREGS